MFWKSQPAQKQEHPADKCRLEARELYHSGKYHCAEAVMEVARRHFSPETPAAVVAAVSGFGGGSGSGCICGAVSGATVALGMILQDKKQTTRLTRELHTWFKEQYGATCCKIIRANNDKGICAELTGQVAGKLAEMLAKHSE